MEQCLYCVHWLFFKPLPDETLTCCAVWGETVRDIDIYTGVSPATKKYGLEGNLCERFEPGISICQPDRSDPFLLHPIRKEGEEFLFKLFNNQYQI